MKLLLLILLLAVGVAAYMVESGSKPSPSSTLADRDQITVSTSQAWRYLVQLPEGYGKDDRQWPLVVFLHGSGERGSDLDKVAKNGPPKLVAEGRRFPFILVSPQCPTGLWWAAPEVDEFVAQLAKRYRVDPKRIYLTGLSMGGYGTWDTASYNPGRYAAIVPVCGNGWFEPEDVGRQLKDMPVWAFHGAKDPVVPPQGTRERVDAINAAGGHAKLTMYPEAGHDCWTPTYNNQEVYDWLLSQHKP